MSRRNDNLVQRIWYGESPLRWLLVPFTLIYSAIVASRRFLFSIGVLRSHRVSVPVIIVGNVAVGGTGKTPVAIWLARRLTEEGMKPAIVSRGYGGEVGAEPKQVTTESDPAEVGDEAVLAAIRSDCPVIVHPDRVAAAKLAIEIGANVIVSDDGLQHYRLERDYEIVVVDGTRRYGNRQLLPAGPLREPVSRLDAINQLLVQREADGSSELLHRSSDRKPLDFRLVASAVCRLDNSDTRIIDEFSGSKVHAIAGIGNPERFFRMLESRDIEVIRHPLPDHAEITPADLEFDDELDVLMTEKDAMKCRWLDTSNCWYVPVDVAINDAAADDLIDRILSKMSQEQKRDEPMAEYRYSVLFVCVGNICRSPTAEGVFKQHLSDAGLHGVIHSDSAGTHAYHAGEPADRRAQTAASRRGFSLEGIRARRVTDEDYEQFDYILAMDKDNLMELKERAPDTHRSKVRLFLDFAESRREKEVPDPYYGGSAGFERVLDLVEEASLGLLETLRKEM